MDASDRTESSEPSGESDQAGEQPNLAADLGFTMVGEGIVAGVGKVVRTVVDAVIN